MKSKSIGGSVILVVMCFAAMGAMLVAVLMFASGSAMKRARQEYRFERAFFIAEAGLERAKLSIATNLLNDAGDYESGIDRGQRLGPDRAVAKGWLSARQVKRAGLGCLLLAFALGMYLAWIGGWPIVILGLVALFCGWAYTMGPAPISHGPLGEVFVWVFFGLAAVLGSYYLQTGTLSRQIWILGHMMGAFASAVMLVNNTRDAASDALAGKDTLSVRIGLTASRMIYAAMLAVPYLLAASQARNWVHALPHLTLPLALVLAWRMATWEPSRRHNWLLARTAHLQLAFTVLWVLALMLD